MAAIGIVVVLVANYTDAADNFYSARNWFYAILGVPGLLTILSVLIQVREQGEISHHKKQRGYVLVVQTSRSCPFISRLQIAVRGYLGPVQRVLRTTTSWRNSIGQSYRGFMSDVREELEV